MDADNELEFGTQFGLINCVFVPRFSFLAKSFVNKKKIAKYLNLRRAWKHIQFISGILDYILVQSSLIPNPIKNFLNSNPVNPFNYQHSPIPLTHISKATNLFLSDSPIVQVSHPYPQCISHQYWKI